MAQHRPLVIPSTELGTDDVYSTDSTVGTMRYVTAGTFTQGSPSSEPCRTLIEPQFVHVLTRNLAVMETEVTRAMWAALKAVQNSLPSDPTSVSHGSGVDNPVQYVTWYEAVLFANLLSVQNGLVRCYYTDASFSTPIDATNYTSGPFYCNFSATGYRLLSEGEWEYAARAGTSGPFSLTESNYTSATCGSPYCVSGEFPMLEQYAVFCANSNYQTEPVGSKLRNPWNLHDMHGNVSEWCWDWYGTYPSDTTDYTGPASGSYRICRGGSWFSYGYQCRSAKRAYNPPSNRSYGTGFRLARTVN